jgi:anti-sigma regulatory factor (Ser/Thr protein kinase)
MRPDQAAPPKTARPATAEPPSARPELERLRTLRRRQRRVFRALGEAVSALRLRAAALHAESADLRVRAAALRAELHAARELRAALAPTGVRVGAGNERALSLDERAPADARIAVTEFLNHQVPASVLDSARLVITELVSNSVRHSGVSDGVVVVGVQLTAAMVRLEVADPGRAGVIGPRSPDHEDGGGFGLQLVASLSERWGLERVAAGGTRVWAQLLRTPPTSNGGTPLELDGTIPLVQDRSHRTRKAGRSPAARLAREQRASARRVALVRERARTLARGTR